MASSSACSAAGSDPHVMPPPVPNSALPVVRSTVTVRMATLNRARKDSPGGATTPTAPQYTPRGSGSSSRMSSMVRCFGAPVTEPDGNSARNTSTSPVPGRGRAVTSEVSCHTVS